MKVLAFKPGERVADIGAGTGFFTFYAKKLLPGLAPGGRLVIIDYIPKPMSERPWGPPPEQQFPRAALDSEMAAAGFKVLAAHDFLPEQFFVAYGVR